WLDEDRALAKIAAALKPGGWWAAVGMCSAIPTGTMRSTRRPPRSSVPRAVLPGTRPGRRMRSTTRRGLVRGGLRGDRTPPRDLDADADRRRRAAALQHLLAGRRAPGSRGRARGARADRRRASSADR